MILYDDQASLYDQRAGLRPDVPRRIAQAVSEVHGSHGESFLLEIGVGTGQIGIELADVISRYSGFDHSFEMLRQFRDRMHHRRSALIFQADGRNPWPVTGRKIRTFFGSRSLHLIPPEHFLQEVAKAGDPDGFFVLQGIVRRKKDSLHEQISCVMQEHLLAEGYQGHKHRRWKKAILQASDAYRAVRLPEVVVAAWPTSITPLRVLRSWTSKQGLAGLDVPQPVKARVLEKTEGWALSRFGSLTREIESTEEYELFGLSFPPRRVEHGDQ